MAFMVLELNIDLRDFMVNPSVVGASVVFELRTPRMSREQKCPVVADPTDEVICLPGCGVILAGRFGVRNEPHQNFMFGLAVVRASPRGAFVAEKRRKGRGKAGLWAADCKGGRRLLDYQTMWRGSLGAFDAAAADLPVVPLLESASA
jgi:hypothetical protein